MSDLYKVTRVQWGTKGLILLKAPMPAHAFLHIYSIWVSNVSSSSSRTPKHLLCLVWWQLGTSALLADMPCSVAWELTFRLSTPLRCLWPQVAWQAEFNRNFYSAVRLIFRNDISLFVLFLLFNNIVRKFQFQGIHFFALHSLIFLFLLFSLFFFAVIVFS